MIKVKICGMRSLQDVKACQGADALGFIVVTPESPRNIGLGLAERLMAAAAPGQLKVAVTASVEPKTLARIAFALEADILQVHAELSFRKWEEVRTALPAGVKLYGLLGISDSEAKTALIERACALARAPLDALVSDTKSDHKSGGIGRPHDWRKSRAIREAIYPLPVILAGGLTPDNVREAIKIVKPKWIDVSSGVEEEGIKSPRKVEELLRRAKDEAEPAAPER